MPIVPFTRAATGATSGPAPTPPPEPFALMAAAQMHSEGRLIQPTGMDTSGFHKSDNIEDRRDWTVQQIVDAAKAERDNATQAPLNSYGVSDELGRKAGTNELDRAIVSNADRRGVR